MWSLIFSDFHKNTERSSLESIDVWDQEQITQIGLRMESNLSSLKQLSTWRLPILTEMNGWVIIEIIYFLLIEYSNQEEINDFDDNLAISNQEEINDFDDNLAIHLH